MESLLMLHAGPLGATLQVRSTVPWNALMLVRVRPNLADPPGLTSAVEGEGVRVKSGGGRFPVPVPSRPAP